MGRAGLEGAWSERGLVWRGWQAHFVRRESCNSDSSPEPSARLFGEGACWEEGGLDGAMMEQAVSVVVRCGRRLEGVGVLCEGAVAWVGI